MTTMGTMTTARANGHAPPAAPALRLPVHGDAPAWLRQDDPAQPRTAVNERERRKRPDGTAFIVVALFSAAQVAVVAFSGSWQHQYELSVHLRQAHWVAGMQPLSVEGLIAAATLVIWYAGRHGYRRRQIWGAYLVLAAGIGQSVLMNLGADSPWPWLRLEISVWPAVAFVAAYEMAVWLVRKRQDVAARAEHDAAPAVQSDAVPVFTPHHESRGENGGEKPSRRPPSRKAAAPVKKIDRAAAAIRDNPGMKNAELAALAGCDVRTIQQARNGKTGSTP